jgi:DNA topoisomerase IA
MSALANAVFFDQGRAGDFAAEIVDNDLIVVDRQEEIITEQPPQPHTTVDLIEDAADRWGWSSSQVMAVAQAIFESGWITYPRTDSIRLAPAAVVDLRSAVIDAYGIDALNPNHNGQRNIYSKGILSPNIKKQGIGELFRHWILRQPVDEVEQGDEMDPNIEACLERSRSLSVPFRVRDAHEAIRPTDPSQIPDSLEIPEQRELYRLIWQRCLASQMKAATYRLITVELSA